MLDAVAALRSWLAARPAVAALIGARSWVDAIPREEIEAQDTYHPEKMLVIRHAGGAGKADRLPTEDQTVTALCYGETAYEAGKVRRAVWEELVNLDRVDQDGVLIYHCNPAGGPLPLRDPEIVWPAVAQNFSFKAAVL